MAWIDGVLADILCERHERTAGLDNCVKRVKWTMQMSANKHRCRYVKTKAEAHRYPV
ncbi:MAG: hypothetical protein LBU11_11165 [Zoogloeaceae bacterium]|nr:hypothetical protein [Zoogloeaceae bacterium]